MGENTNFRQRQSGPTFRFKEDYSRERFFWFSRDLVKSGEWGTWPTSAQAVFPVLLYFMDKAKGTCFPSMDTIGILCGRDRKTVSEGIEYLLTRPIPLKRSMRITEQGRKAYSYSYPVVTRQSGLFFPFRHGVIDGGNWLRLTPTAQALYVTMRTYGGLGFEDLSVVFGEDCEDDFQGEFAKRDFEFCRADKDVLGWKSGIKTYQTLDTALESLSACFLAERAKDMDCDEIEVWKVFLKPPSFFKRDYLNAQIDKKYPLSKKLSKSLSKKLSKSLTKRAKGFAHVSPGENVNEPH